MLLFFSVVLITRFFFRYIMFFLYCLLYSGDDNFKVLIFFLVGEGGGRVEVVYGGLEFFSRVLVL